MLVLMITIIVKGTIYDSSVMMTYVLHSDNGDDINNNIHPLGNNARIMMAGK